MNPTSIRPSLVLRVGVGMLLMILISGNLRTAPPNLALTPSTIPLPEKSYPIDLNLALKIAEVDNPSIGISRQAIQSALAEQLRANALLAPTLRAGANYHNHQGILQSSFGQMRQVDSSSLYAGGGAGALAASTVPMPMLQLISPLGDAFLEPLIARRQLAVRMAQNSATANAMLLEVSTRYLDLIAAQGDLQAVRQSEGEMNEVVQLTATFANAGQGRDADASRARAEALLLLVERQKAEEKLMIAGARLAEVLNLDPALRFEIPQQALGLMPLIDLKIDSESLVNQAFSSRPELSANRAEIDRRQMQLRQEQVRPWLPTLSIGYSVGTYGGGTNRTDLVPIHSSFGNFGGRSDLDIIAYWTLQNLGVGNIALQNERRSQRNEAQLETMQIRNEIRRQVMSSHQRAQAAQQRIELARKRLETADEGYRADFRRIRGGIGLPIEILNSVQRLTQARRNIVQCELEYNLNQFQLFVAVGRNPINFEKIP